VDTNLDAETNEEIFEQFKPVYVQLILTPGLSVCQYRERAKTTGRDPLIKGPIRRQKLRGNMIA